jgi:tetratricopeptide (TPR) repeat protein
MTKRKMKLTTMIALFTVSTARAMAQNTPHDPPVGTCLELNQAAMTHAANGRLAEAEALLASATAAGRVSGEGPCAGIILSNLARTVSILGRTAEAERLVERSVRILEKLYPENNWVLLRPLQILAAIQLESGKIARARETVQRLQSIQSKQPEDRALIHATVGALRQIEGRRGEAEAEYHYALRAWEESGRSESADAGAILHCLGALYIQEQRLDEARQVLDRALIIHQRAKDSLPIDRIKFLDLRGVLQARLGEWQQSEQDFRDALSLADREPYMDPALFRPLLSNYAYVLRRNHHRREARSIEARRGALPANRTAAAVVDLSELLTGKDAPKQRSIR